MATTDHIHREADPEMAKRVKVVDGFEDHISEKVTLVATTSKTLEELLTADFAQTDVGVTIVSDGTVQYNPVGAADGNNGFLPTVYTIHGGIDKLQRIELYAAAETTLSIIIFKIVQ
jgi:hypothetical protein